MVDFWIGVFEGSLEDSLWFLHKFVKDGAERDQKLDDILIPIIQHVFLISIFFPLIIWCKKLNSSDATVSFILFLM